MRFHDTKNDEQNWFDALHLWDKVCNWRAHKSTDLDQLVNMKNLITLLWNEKDWMKSSYGQPQRVEEYVNSCEYWPVVGDVANMLKHRAIDPGRQRTAVEVLDRVIEVGVQGKEKRKAYFVRLGKERTVELQKVVRGALDEIESLKFAFVKEKL